MIQVRKELSLIRDQEQEALKKENELMVGRIVCFDPWWHNMIRIGSN